MIRMTYYKVTRPDGTDAGAEARAALHALQVALVNQPLPVYPFPITESEARLLDGNR